MKKISRRKFIKYSAVASLGAAGCLPHVEGDWQSCSEPLPTPSPPPSPRVVEVLAPEAVDQQAGRLVEAKVVQAFESGLLELTQKATIQEAWNAILPGWQAGQKISLKVNTLNAEVPTSPLLVAAVVDSLLRSGYPAGDIFVWDRTLRELERAGYSSQELGVELRGTYVSSSDQSGPGYEEEAACLSGKKIYLSRLLTRQTNHLINIAVLKNHFAAKFTACLKNHYGSFSRPYDFHADSDLHIARLNCLPAIASVSRLQIVDAFFGVCLGDTDKPADCAPGRLLIGFDPVAVDKRAVEIRDLMRQQVHGQEPGPQPGYLEEAERLGLGSTAYELVPIEL